MDDISSCISMKYVVTYDIKTKIGGHEKDIFFYVYHFYVPEL